MDLVDMASQTPSYGQILSLSHPRTRCLGGSSTVVIEQVQLRRYYSNVGALNLNLWVHTLTEVWPWRKSTEELVNRQASPWDQADCRPSHADRRKSLKQYVMRQEYLRLDIPDRLRKRIQQFVEMLQLPAA